MKWFRLLQFLFRSSFMSAKSSWFLQFVTAGTLAIAFLILGGSFTIFMNVRHLLLGSSSSPMLSVYFGPEADAKLGKKLQEKFCDRSFVKTCRQVSSQEARSKFIAQYPDLKNSVSSLDENPFPASLEIDLDSQMRDKQNIRNFSQELQAIPGVEAVDDGGGWLDRWISLLNVADWATWVLGIGLGGAMVFVVANTIKLVVYARRDEVDILNLVGATPMMIRIPFVLEGLIQGFVGGLIALFVLNLVFAYAKQHLLSEWGALASQMVFFSWPQQCFFVFSGAALGFVGSTLAVGKFLRA